MRLNQIAWRRSWAVLVLLAIGISRAEETAPTAEGDTGRVGVTVRVAAVSFVSKKFDLAGNADQLEKSFHAARKGGAKIVVAPEGSLDGYVANEVISG